MYTMMTSLISLPTSLISLPSSRHLLCEGRKSSVVDLKRDKKFIMNATHNNIDSNATSRPLANFHPSVWGDRFLLSDLEYNQLIKRGEELSAKVEALTQEIKIELKETNEYPLKQLELIDTIQRLGIGYHFEVEIDQALQNIYDNILDWYKSTNDLYFVALSFRLLRQNGNKVSCDIFEKFKDVKGEFKASLTDNVMGMLEFYEATYLSIQGEDVLDHGRAFTGTYLQSILPSLINSSIGEQVFHALDYSNRRELPRLAARKYISICERRATRHENLLQLAKLDFNHLQYLYKRELGEFSSWWKGLDVQKNFWFARDRCVEIYIWAWAPYFEPQYSIARKYLCKPMALISIIDDMFDAYGTLEELQVFNEAIQRWSTPCLDSHPDCYNILYKALWETFEEIEDGMVKLGAEYRTSYGKEAFKIIVQAYFDEAKWREGKHEPGIKEYMTQGTRTTAYASLTILACMGMGDIATKEVFDWLFTVPPLIRAANVICRLTGDIVAHEFERERDHIPSAVECYMKEHGVSKQETYVELKRSIEVAWKDVNECMLRPTNIPLPILDCILNLTRILESIYKKGDWYTHVGPEMQSYIKQLFIDPVPE